MQVERMIDDFINGGGTLLGAGPMSKLTIEVLIDEANRRRSPVALIPSRRQIDSAELGGGYVEAFTTEAFVEFVRAKDSGGFVLLARDHSGPWQKETHQDGEIMSHAAALNEVKRSLRVDVECGFDLIHIDPSQGLHFGRTPEQVEDDILELASYVSDISGSRQGSPLIEVGADEQSAEPDTLDFIESQYDRICESFTRQSLKLPKFFVAQTGTKVMEMRNVGSFARSAETLLGSPNDSKIPEIVRLLETKGVFLKEHNADYLSDKALMLHSILGIHAANVAPEFGVCETRELLQLAKELGATWFVDEFSRVVLEGGKFQKWLLADTSSSEKDKVLIAGHYHFASDEVIALRQKLSKEAARQSIDADARVRAGLEECIGRYLKFFGYPK